MAKCEIYEDLHTALSDLASILQSKYKPLWDKYYSSMAWQCSGIPIAGGQGPEGLLSSSQEANALSATLALWCLLVHFDTNLYNLNALLLGKYGWESIFWHIYYDPANILNEVQMHAKWAKAGKETFSTNIGFHAKGLPERYVSTIHIYTGASEQALCAYWAVGWFLYHLGHAHIDYGAYARSSSCPGPPWWSSQLSWPPVGACHSLAELVAESLPGSFEITASGIWAWWPSKYPWCLP